MELLNEGLHVSVCGVWIASRKDKRRKNENIVMMMMMLALMALHTRISNGLQLYLAVGVHCAIEVHLQSINTAAAAIIIVVVQLCLID